MCIFLFYFYVFFFQISSNKPESPLLLHLHHIILQTLFIVTNNVTIAEIVEQVWRKAVPLETFGKKMLPFLSLTRAKAEKSTSQSSQAEKPRQQIWPQVT